jgi:type II secretory pathway predicted ATPase ExeA
MYESFFRLTARPFTAAVDVQNYIPAASIEHARQALVRCLNRGEGAALVIAAPGTGKSLLCKLVAADLRGAFQVVELRGGNVSNRRGLFQAILRELDLPYRLDDAELRLTLADYIEHGTSSANGLVLLVDEAQSFSVGLLEELRLLSNVPRAGQVWVRVGLLGSPELEERLASPKLESFAQRIAARCYLQPLDKDETRAYVGAWLARCGAPAESIFAPDAIDRIHIVTEGVPRLINQVCDHALVLAFAGGRRKIHAAGIEEAWADLQQLPTPVQTAPAQAAEESVIEFGTLTDLEESVPGQLAADQAVETELDASRQLERIEAHLGKLEREYQVSPPEKGRVAFRFHDPVTTRPVSFQQEEVVIDRYAELDTASRRRRVDSHEGRSLGPMLEPLAGTSAESADALPGGLPAGKLARSESSEDAEDLTADLREPPKSPVVEAHTLFGKLAQQRTAADLDDDEIVIEEEVETLPIESSPLAKPVRRQQYRQLFARLRRG